VGNRCADHVTPLYPQKLALTSPTGGGRSVGIVRVRTKATEFLVLYTVCFQLRIATTVLQKTALADGWPTQNTSSTKSRATLLCASLRNMTNGS